MAGSLSILVNGCSSIKQLVDHLEQIVGHRFVKSQSVEWNLYQTDALHVQLSVFDDPDFENDQNIEFDRFSFVIDVQALSAMEGNVYYAEWLKLAPLLVASILSEELNCECMVVENLQHIVKSFSPSSREQTSSAR